MRDGVKLDGWSCVKRTEKQHLGGRGGVGKSQTYRKRERGEEVERQSF